LRAQQAALQAQIESVRASNTAEAYTAVQLTERFANVLDLARGLAGDFRQLEENFKEVARALAEAQAQPGATKGGIVGQLLDTHAALKDSSQGQSFYAFWNLLSSPERQQRWRELTRQVYRLESIDPGLRANRLLERLSSRLLVEGERVVRSNERMAATLRRALENNASGEDRRLRELIREIQQLALSFGSLSPKGQERLLSFRHHSGSFGCQGHHSQRESTNIKWRASQSVSIQLRRPSPTVSNFGTKSDSTSQSKP